MDLKPNDFFIGLVEFITIMLPGAALALIILLVDYNRPMQTDHFLYQYALGDNVSILFWFAFILSAFGLGYFLSSIASGLDGLYDFIRDYIYPTEEALKRRFKCKLFKNESLEKYESAYLKSLERTKQRNCEPALPQSELKKEDRLYIGFKESYLTNPLRWVVFFLFELERRIKVEKSYDEARKLLDAQPKTVSDATNVYKWAGAILESQYPTLSDQAQRTMAASKFFRSLVIVSLMLLLFQICRLIPFDYWWVNIVILLLSFREYVVQRHKSVQRTFQSIVSLSHYKKEEGDSQMPVV